MHSLTAQNSKIEFAELYQLISNIGIFEVRARPDAAMALFIPWYDIVLLKFSTYDFCDRWESKGV